MRCALTTLIAVAFALIASAPVPAFASLPPHVTDGTVSPDACAICHRTHTGNVDMQYRTTTSVEPTGNALIIAPPPEFGTPGFPTPGRGDVGLCFTCHGAAGLGSQFDVETSFALESTHTIAPLASTFGPSPKMCSSCHDSHGTARTTAGDPYPRLLRSWADTTTAVYTGDGYCTTCHTSRPASRFSSLAVYEQTGHYTGLADPVSGTGIRCSICHTPHGSAIAPLIVAQVTPPAVAVTTAVVANDRRFCLDCHPDPAYTWSGETTYALSAHAASAATVAITGEWPASGASRRVGECQVCHAPMGRDDGSGNAIAKLLEKPGRALCDTCHTAGGAAATDLKSLAYPASESVALELAVGWGPDPRSDFAGRTDVYGRATSGADPRPLIGPRSYAAPGESGAVAVGDVDGDLAMELVRADAVDGTLTLLHGDALLGLSAAAPQAVAGSPDLVAVGRFVEPTTEETLAGIGPRPQIAVLDASTSTLRLYENMVGGALTLVASRSYALGGTTATGLAAGDFTGDGLADLAITTQGPDQLLLLSENAVLPSELTMAAVPAPPQSPRGPAIGDADPAAGVEIVACDTVAGTVRVYDASGTLLRSSAALGGTPWATAVGNVLPGVAGNEIAVSVQGAAGSSELVVLDQTGASQSFPATGIYSGSVIVADIDGDGRSEALMGNAGLWNGASGMTAPSVDVYRPDSGGTTLAHAATLEAGTSALAGAAPGLAVADFGPVLPSRHPIDEVAASHVSTETGAFARHVTCSDCHDSHEASSGIAASAPLVTGDMRGAWGTAVTNTGAATETFDPSARAVRQYEVCFKCHATTADGRANIASLVNTENVSVHAVEGASSAPTALAGSYVDPVRWSNISVLYCSDCHGDSASPPDAKGLHRSGQAPLLKAPYTATSASDGTMLCYTCHKKSTYYDGTPPTGTDGVVDTSSRFFDYNRYSLTPSGGSLHSYHVDTWADGGLGLTCDSCHVSHGSVTKEHLIRTDVGYTHAADGGSCTNGCHASNPKDYTYNLIP